MNLKKINEVEIRLNTTYDSMIEIKNSCRHGIMTLTLEKMLLVWIINAWDFNEVKGIRIKNVF